MDELDLPLRPSFPETGPTHLARQGALAQLWLRLRRQATLLWAGLTFLSLALAAFLLSQSASDKAMQIAHERFEFKASEAQFAIRQRLLAYEQVLRGGSALFEATASRVSRTMWRDYVAGLAIDRNYPGIQGIGYSERVLPQDRGTVIARVRGEGFPDFDIVPSGEREEYTSIVFLEPFDWRNKRAFGYDMFSEPVRRAAMARARDSGQPAVSGKVILVQETQREVQNGFLMYLPLYRDNALPETAAERRAALLGFVYAPFRMRDLMQGILRNEQLSNIRLEIFDGPAATDEALLHDSTDRVASASALNADRQLQIGGHTWTIRYTSRPAFDATIDRQTPLMILLGGSVLAFLIAAIVWSLASNRSRARELAQANNALHEEIAERMKLETELIGARDAAEAANRAKSAFLANMSHELRTPLNAVLGYAQMLGRDKSLSEWQTGAVDTIRRSGEHLLTLIGDVLDLSKIEAGKLELTSRPVSLTGLLRGVAEIVRVRAEERQLSFFFDLPSSLPSFVNVDDKRLRQVLLNLLGNAVKFTDCGHVRFAVDRLDESDREIRLRVSVEDTGIGIEEDQFKTIFEPFEQVSDIGRRSAGTGLGLSITRDLVRLMGSNVEVASTPGGGSRFWFELTLLIAERQDERPIAASSMKGYRGERRTVLVVDDTPENRAVLCDLLEKVGFGVVQATNGLEAVETVEASAPDLVLMDVMTPVMDGLEAMRRIRERPSWRDLPMIAVSASVASDDRARSLDAGADAFLAKPLDHLQLLREMGRLLDLDWIEDAADEPDDEPDGAIVAPPESAVAELSDLARAGNMRRIRSRVAELAEQDSRYRPFAARVMTLAAEFDSPAILRLMAAHLEERKGAA
ncbi:CHASE domain-containing protein [Allomesorhizobium camelthorni]|uniref:histidine kinase n=1 Tax=Allomesorhizobium camelthorni TaxID=475069 RepID=A0A6G4W972_9HYPH|nr:CHASE domain-containing protein [Mesorhizobium camelthorni]NGO51114.1 response regulator [Mesorhizobium camelthorni]